jgi:hypothetical protein
MIAKLIEIGSCYGMETNVEQTKVMRISRQQFPVKLTIDQKQQENVEFFKYLVSTLTNDGRCTVKLNPELLWQKLHLTRRGLFFTSKMDLELRKKLVKCYVWNIVLYGVETWTLRVADQKHLGSF